MLKKAGLRPVISITKSRGLVVEFSWAVLFAFLIGSVAGLAGIWFEMHLGQRLETPDALQPTASASAGLPYVCVLVMAFTVAPVVEEVFFRGFVYNAFKSRMRTWLAVCIQALVFSAAHAYAIPGSSIFFITGTGLAIVYEKRKTLLTPILVHAGMNAAAIIPVLLFSVMNLSMPASTWEEAHTRPSWLHASPPDWVERHSEAYTQLQYALDIWGEDGYRLWKREVNSLAAVSFIFPKDDVVNARAVIEMARVYYQYLRDYRRAVTESDRVIERYPTQTSEIAGAWVIKGWSYYMLRDFDKSRSAFEKVLSDYQEYADSVERAREGLGWIGEISGG